MKNRDRVLRAVQRLATIHGGVARVTQQDLADLLGVSVRTVRRALAELEADGQVATGIVPLSGMGQMAGRGQPDWPDAANRSDRAETPAGRANQGDDNPSACPEEDTPRGGKGGVSSPPVLFSFPSGSFRGGEEKRPKRARGHHDLELAEHLRTARFAAAWADWQAYRLEVARRQKAPWTEGAARRAAATLARMSEDEAIRSIHQSIDCGWKGLFPPKDHDDQPARAESLADRAARLEAE